MIKIVRAKLHGIRVTGADLNYHGSITLDPDHCRKASIYPLEFVEVWNKNSGARISTYVIFGEPGSGCCVLNGAAARTCQTGDELIITAAEYTTPDQLYDVKPSILTFLPGNRIDQVLEYDVFESAAREHDFRILDVEQHRPRPAPQLCQCRRRRDQRRTPGQGLERRRGRGLRSELFEPVIDRVAFSIGCAGGLAVINR